MEVNGSASPMDVDIPPEAACPTKEEVPKDGPTGPLADGGKVDRSKPSAAEAPVTSTSDSEDELPGEGEAAAKKSSSKSPEEKLVKAVTYKDKGNACITTDSASALKHYERGIKIASSLSTDDQAEALLVSLRLNLSLACFKEERYFEAASAATKVLEVESTNTKAFYRRGVARAQLGFLEDARSDLTTVKKLDPSNTAAKKELNKVVKQLDEYKKKEKARYGGLFAKGPMYNDKEVERQKREAEAAKRQKEEEVEWRRVNLRRKAEGKEEQSLEDWRKEKKTAEEETKKKRQEEEKRKQKPPRPANANRPPKAPSNKGEEAEGDKVHDEEDMQIIKDALGQGGYCYFNRKLSEKEQSLLDEEQKKLRARVSPPAVQKKSLDAASATEGARSVWNEAGTWEEVNKTEWCKGKLMAAFSKVKVTVGKDPASDPEFLLEKLGSVDFASIGGDAAGGKGLQALAELKHSLAKLQASVTNVEIPGGEAHIICVSNKIKHMFEFNVKLKFSLTIDESMGMPSKAEGEQGSKEFSASVKTYNGKLEFPDMTNNDVENGRFDPEPELKWDKGKKWDSMYDNRVKSCITELKSSTLSALGSFFAEFKGS